MTTTTPPRRVRALTAAERHIDAERAAAKLDTATDHLERLVRAEMARSASHAVHGRPHVAVTPAMLRVLVRLEREGRRDARAEAASMGVRTPTDFAAADVSPRIRGLAALLGRILDALGRAMAREAADALALGATRSRARVVAARISGARAASRGVVTRAYFGGHAELYEKAAGVFPAWQYTAVLDGGTCPQCKPLDGKVYPTWDAILVVLPDGGPNPACLGGNRCRCRAVPIPPAAGADAAFAVAPNGDRVAAPQQRIPVLDAQGAAELLTRVNAEPDQGAALRRLAAAAQDGQSVGSARALLAIRDPDAVERHPLGVAYTRTARGRTLRVVVVDLHGRLVVLHVEDVAAERNAA